MENLKGKFTEEECFYNKGNCKECKDRTTKTNTLGDVHNWTDYYICDKVGLNIRNHPGDSYSDPQVYYTPITCPKNPLSKKMSEEEKKYRNWLYSCIDTKDKREDPRSLTDIRNYVKYLEKQLEDK
jgi:hypothetical protein